MFFLCVFYKKRIPIKVKDAPKNQLELACRVRMYGKRERKREREREREREKGREKILINHKKA